MSTNEEKLISTTQADESENELQSISELPPKMQRFIHLYMTGQYTLNKLAQLLEVHPNTLSNWMRRKDVKEAIEDVQNNVHDQVATHLKALTLKATSKLHELMDSPIDGVALQAVKDVLDRAGHKTKQEIKIDKTVTTVEEKLRTLIDSTISLEGEYEEVD